MAGPYDYMIAQAAEREGLDPWLLMGVVDTESGSNPDAVNPDTGATGLGQIMADTGLRPGAGVPTISPEDRKDPAKNIDFTASYLAWLRDRHGGDMDEALRAYNWGTGNLEKLRSGDPDADPVPTETLEYLPKVRAAMAARLEEARQNVNDTGPADPSWGLMGPPAPTRPDDIAATSSPDMPLMPLEAPVHSQQAPAQVPTSFWERRGDDLEMLGKGLASGLVQTASLALRVADGPLEITGGAADWMERQSENITASLPKWIQEDLAHEVFRATEDGGWEFNMPSLRQVAHLAVQSVGPGGAIALGGKGLAKAGVKYLPKMFKEGSRLAPAAAYGAANSAYIAADSYHNAYSSVYQDLLGEGKDEIDAHNEAEAAGRMAALGAGALSFVTGSVGGLAMTAGGVLRRVAVGAGLGSATEAIEEPGQYVAEQLAAGEPVDPLEVGSRAVLGAFAAGPMEGALAGLTGAPNATAADGGRRMIDNILGDVPTSAEKAARDALAPTELDLQLDYHAELDATRDALPESLPPAPPPPAASMGTPEQVTSTAGPLTGEPVELTLDEAANEAATSPTNDMEELNEWQKETGKYRKGNVELHGLDISIENPQGSTRKGPGWEVEMQDHYGYIKRTEANDGDAIDVFIGPNAELAEPTVAIVDQRNPETGEFDEHKVIIGYEPGMAEETYYRNYSPDFKDANVFAGVTEIDMGTLNEWLESGDTKKPYGPGEFTTLDEVDVAEMKGPQIRAELKKRGLNVSGKVADIRQRLFEAVVSPDQVTEPAPEPEPEPELTPEEQKKLTRLQTIAATEQARADAETTTAGMKGKEIDTMLRNRGVKPGRRTVEQRRQALNDVLVEELTEESVGTVAEPALTPEEESQVDALQAKVDALEAQAKIASIEEDQSTPGLMVDEEEDFDPVAAMAAATAKTAETAPADMTPEELETQSREVHTEEVRRLKGKPLTAAMKAAGLDPTIKGKKLAQRQDELIEARVTAEMNAPALTDPNADAVAAEARALAAQELRSAQTKWDADTKKIEAKTVTQLRGIMKKMGIPFTSKDRKATLIEKLSKDRSPRPEAAPEVAPAEPAAGTPSPVATPDTPSVETPPVQPTTPAEAPMSRAHVRAGKPTQIPHDVITKHWGNDWLEQAKVYRIAVGNLVYTVWRGTKMQESGGLMRSTPGKLGNYVAVLGEPKNFNPRQDQFNPIPTGATRLRPGRDGSAGADAHSFVEEHGNTELTRLFDEAVREGRRKEPPTPIHETHMTEAKSLTDNAVDKDISREATIEAGMRLIDLGRAVSDNAKATELVRSQWRRLAEHYETKREPGETTGLTEAAVKEGAKRVAAQEAAKTEARRIANQQERLAGQRTRSQSRREHEANTMPTEADLNEFERATLENERKRGVAWDTLRYLWRNWRGNKSKEDLDFEQTQGSAVTENIQNMSIMDVIQRFRRGEVLRWTTAGIDQSVYLREVMTTLKKVLPEDMWSDDMNIRDLLDAVVPKTKNRMTQFARTQLKAYADRLAAEGVSHEDMTQFAGALHAMWRNAHLVQRAEVKAESNRDKAVKEELIAQNDWEAKEQAAVGADANTEGGLLKLREAHQAKNALKAAGIRREKAVNELRMLAPSESLSGISNEMIEETLERLVPTPALKAKYTSIFKDHYHAMAKAQRAEYAEGELVPTGKLDEWNVDVPADPFSLPADNDPQYRQKVAEGFHGTYVPLQHEKVDYNLRQVEANLRKPPAPNYNDVAGDEVRTAAGQASDGVAADMPAYIWERMQENLYTAYARRELNDVYRKLGEMVRKNPNQLIWSNLVQSQEEIDQQSAEPELDEFGLEVEPQYMPDSQLRGKDADVPGAKLRRSLGLSDLRDTEFLPLRYKDKDGRQAITRIHSAQFETVFNGESGLGGTPTKYAGKVSQWISKVNTAWSPGFLAAQIPKDFLSAKALLDPAVSKHVTLGRYRQTFKAYWDVTKGHDTPADATPEYKKVRKVIEEEYLPSGSHTTFFNKAKMSDHYTTLKEAIAEANNEPNKNTPVKLLKATGNMLDLANTVVENIPRILAFMGARKEGKTIHQARFIARELNVNFATMGSRGAQINSWYPFYNATVSGNAILYRAFKNSPKFRKAVAAYAGIGLANGIAQSILAGEDDDGRSRYWNLPKHIRDRNFVFFIPGVEQPLKVPLPYGLNAAVVMGDALAEAVMNPEADVVGAVTRSTASVMNTFNPIASSDVIRSALPAVGEPVYDLIRNKNFFGSPISPSKSGPGAGKITDAYNVTDPDQRNVFTTTAQALAWATGGSEFAKGGIDISPGALEYAWDFATGSAGATVRRTFEALFAGSMVSAGTKAPMIRRYFGGVSDFHHKARYYDLREDLAGIQNQRKLLYRNRRINPERYADHVAEYKDYYDRGVMRQFNITEKRLRSLIGVKNKIRKQMGKSDSDKARMTKLNDQIDDTVVRFNRYYFERFVRGDM